jgi:hypothetical protein
MGPKFAVTLPSVAHMGKYTANGLNIEPLSKPLSVDGEHPNFEKKVCSGSILLPTSQKAGWKPALRKKINLHIWDAPDNLVLRTHNYDMASVFCGYSFS